MQAKSKLLLLSILILIIVACSITYWLFFSPPGEFPSKEKVFEAMMETFPEANIKELQETIYLDAKHVFVPFITNDEGYGSSLWEWRRNEWEFVSIDTGSTPRMWTIDPENPSSYFIVWNFHPDNQLKKLTFYLIKNRGFSVSEGKEIYQPGVEINFEASLEGKTSYGYSEIPKEWGDYIRADRGLMEKFYPITMFTDLFQPPKYYFGWRAMTMDGSEDYAPFSKTSNGFGTGDNFIEPMRYIDKQELR